jgi:hypothetical protein
LIGWLIFGWEWTAPARHRVWTTSQAVPGFPVFVRSASELIELGGLEDRTKSRNQILRPLLAGGFLATTIPDKPRGSGQGCRTAPAGEASLRENGPETDGQSWTIIASRRLRAQKDTKDRWQPLQSYFRIFFGLPWARHRASQGLNWPLNLCLGIGTGICRYRIAANIREQRIPVGTD